MGVPFQVGHYVTIFFNYLREPQAIKKGFSLHSLTQTQFNNQYSFYNISSMNNEF
jgi:hypothetical protein